jgi:hypothetical protein
VKREMKTLENGLKGALLSSSTILGEGWKYLKSSSYKAEIKSGEVCRWRIPETQ